MTTDEKTPRSFLVRLFAGAICAAVAGGVSLLNFPDSPIVAVAFASIGFVAGFRFGPEAIGALVTVL